MAELNQRRTSWTLAFLLALPLAGGCGKTVSEAIDDTTITTRVKTAMLNDPSVGGLRIDVDTFKSIVTLTGRVKSQSEHDQAVALARRVNGVSEVKDSLQVIPDAPR
jgi:osmotically-inducible protein OsmY